MTLYNFVTAIIAAFAVGVIIVLARRQRLGLYNTLWWMLAVVGILTTGFFPQLLDKVGWALGIHYPPILPIILALCILFVKVLTMDMERSRQEMKIRILAQKMAAYEAELLVLRKQAGADADEL